MFHVFSFERPSGVISHHVTESSLRAAQLFQLLDLGGYKPVARGGGKARGESFVPALAMRLRRGDVTFTAVGEA